jgi:hypothetical protein
VSDDDAILSGLKIDIQLAIFSFAASYPQNPESHVASATDPKSREQRHAGSGEGEWAGGVSEHELSSIFHPAMSRVPG